MKDFIKNDITRSMHNLVPNLEPLKGKTILITGGTGFIGSWVARALAWLNDESDFHCKIILLARTPENLEKDDPELYRRDDIVFIRSDIRSLNNLPKNINYIIHAAASPDNRVHMSDPVNTMDVISMGTKAVLEAASRLANIEGIVHVSSGQVYDGASSNGEAFSEMMAGGFLKGNVTSVYPEAKRFAETICLAYRSQYKLPINIVRPFAFIGPFQSLKKPWAINSFLQEALNGQSMRMVGNGKPQRSYLYASDMAAWLLAVLAKGERGEKYNLGSSESISLVNVANKINVMIPNPVDVIIQNHNDDESKFIPDLNHIIEQLEVAEVFTFEEALQHTIKWNIDQLDKQGK
ncbi:MAG: NAD-dependent epimerase/dehydratase family protein [Mariprofundaceae bacterium]|nr:NAD-dependent epimerase/dehydratase family protein [Mariprofundaceae bacterium]